MNGEEKNTNYEQNVSWGDSRDKNQYERLDNETRKISFGQENREQA